MAVSCCEFTGAPVVGDTAAKIVIESGSPNEVDGLTFYAEGCSQVTDDNCNYQEKYEDRYCDTTAGGTYPNARVTDITFTISNLPPDSILTIDAAEHSVTLTDETGNVAQSQLDVIDWSGLWEWIEAARNGCQRVCVDTGGATMNDDTTITITTFDREL